MKSDFGDRLRQLRVSAGLTQKQLSEPLEKSESAIRMWELGKNEPDIASLITISNIFDCTLDYLLCKDLSDNGEDYRTNVAVFSSSDYSSDSEPVGFMPLPSKYINDGSEYFVLMCKGNDMFPRFEKGDKVLIRKQDTCFHGQTAFVKIGNNDPCLRKILFQNDNGIVLQPGNTAVESQFFSFDDIESLPVIILGLAVEVFREL